MKVWRGAGVERSEGGEERDKWREKGGRNSRKGRGDINVVITHGD